MINWSRLGVISIALAVVFAIPSGGFSAIAGIGGDCLLMYSLFKQRKALHGKRLGDIENTIQNGLKNIKGG